METIRLKARLNRIGSYFVVRVPERESRNLASRSIVMVKGILNGVDFKTVLEPDGKGSHWFIIDRQLREAAGVNAGDMVTLSMQPTDEWLEPELPTDLKEALSETAGTFDVWKDITPLARWDWIRWINSTKVPETRRRRIEKTCSMFKKGKRRPCCFNRNLCSFPGVSKNGVLLEENTFERNTG